MLSFAKRAWSEVLWPPTTPTSLRSREDKYCKHRFARLQARIQASLVSVMMPMLALQKERQTFQPPRWFPAIESQHAWCSYQEDMMAAPDKPLSPIGLLCSLLWCIMIGALLHYLAETLRVIILASLVYCGNYVLRFPMHHSQVPYLTFRPSHPH